MKKEEIRKQPPMSADPLMDFEFNREASGTGISRYALGKIRMPNGELVITSLYERESDELVITGRGPRRKCVNDAGIEGYRVYKRTVLDPFALEPRLKRIPEADRGEVLEAVRKKYNNLNGKRLDQVFFEW